MANPLKPGLFVRPGFASKIIPPWEHLGSTIVAGMSYIFRNILKGDTFMKEVMIWRVDSGENIRT